MIYLKPFLQRELLNMASPDRNTSHQRLSPKTGSNELHLDLASSVVTLTSKPRAAPASPGPDPSCGRRWADYLAKAVQFPNSSFKEEPLRSSGSSSRRVMLFHVAAKDSQPLPPTKSSRPRSPWRTPGWLPRCWVSLSF